jgi:hypothetical protein
VAKQAIGSLFAFELEICAGNVPAARHLWREGKAGCNDQQLNFGGMLAQNLGNAAHASFEQSWLGNRAIKQ